MARKIVKRFLPDPEWIKQQKSLQVLGSWIHDPNIWHLTRHSVAAASFIGLFMAFVPFPSQMVLAAIASLWMRANLPVAVILVWVSNPITMPPLFYMAYKVGAAILGTPADSFHFELSYEWLGTGLMAIWQPFLLGCLVCGLFFGLLGATFVRVAWRHHTIQRWHKRRLQRQTKNNPSN